MLERKALVLFVCLVTMAFVAGGVATGQKVVKQTDGTVIKGYVVEDTESEITVRTSKGRVKIPYDKLAPETIVALKEKRTPKADADAQLKLAEYALENKVFLPARRHFFMALAANPEMKERVLDGVKRVDDALREELLVLAKEANKTGNTQMQNRVLGHLMVTFPDSKEAEAAEKMLEALKPPDDMDAVIKKLPPAGQKMIEEGRNAFDEAVAHNRKGLKYSRKRGQAEREFNRALKKLRRCETILHRIREEYEQNLDLMKGAKQAEKKLEERQIRVLMNLAHLYTRRQSFIRALEYVNRALLIDENSAVAHQARERIELAQSMSGARGGGGRGRGGR